MFSMTDGAKSQPVKIVLEVSDTLFKKTIKRDLVVTKADKKDILDRVGKDDLDLSVQDTEETAKAMAETTVGNTTDKTRQTCA
jgi:hypothetical protein